MANYVVSDTSLGSVADAIRTKGGTSAPLTYPQGFIDAIDDIQTGGSAVIQSLSVTENGTYTAPAGVDGYSPVTVNVSGGGDTPIPDDGKTRIWIHIADGTPDNRLTFYLRFTASEANNTTVDWGDGTIETLGSTTATNYSHKYPSGGDYIITMTVNSGTIRFEGTKGSGGYSIYGERSGSNRCNATRIKKVVIGDNVTIGDYAFYQCFGLESVTIQGNTTAIGTYAFDSCYSLTSISVSNSVTSFGDNNISSTYAILAITLPDTLVSIGNYFLSNCYGITSITIPDKVTSMGNWNFSNCNSLSEIHMLPKTPPTLGSTISSMPSDCIIYVPQGSLSAYQSATNWSSYSSHMQEEPT